MSRITRILFSLLGAACFLALGLCAAEKAVKPPAWTDPETAAAEHPDFLLQGEYAGKIDGENAGVQAAALDGGKFLVLRYQGGLPGAGWDGGDRESEVLDRADLEALVEGLDRVERESPTLGQAPPEGAVVIFDGKETPEVEGEIRDGLLWAGSATTRSLRDFQLHLEFRLPFKPGRAPSNQDRGNSGVYLFNRYECQVLDSFGLDFETENNAIDLASKNTQWCASFYKVKTPDVPMAFPPLRWQTYDIDFRAPRFEGKKKVANARVTVHHNGVVVHDDVELEKGTGAGGLRPEVPEGTILLQGHGNPVAFRNIWVLEKGGED